MHNGSCPAGLFDSSKIRFTQNNIKDSFKDGKGLDDLIKGLRDGSINPNSIPPIRIFEKDGKMYSLDNRRLYAFQQAGVNIPYRLATKEEVAAEIGRKLTTTNNGISIDIRPKK